MSDSDNRETGPGSPTPEGADTAWEGGGSVFDRPKAAAGSAPAGVRPARRPELARRRARGRTGRAGAPSRGPRPGNRTHRHGAGALLRGPLRDDPGPGRPPGPGRGRPPVLPTRRPARDVLVRGGRRGRGRLHRVQLRGRPAQGVLHAGAGDLHRPGDGGNRVRARHLEQAPDARRGGGAGTPPAALHPRRRRRLRGETSSAGTRRPRSAGTRCCAALCSPPRVCWAWPR